MLEDVQGMLGTAKLPILAAGTVWFLSKPCQGAVSSLPDPHVPPSLQTLAGGAGVSTGGLLRSKFKLFILQLTQRGVWLAKLPCPDSAAPPHLDTVQLFWAFFPH